MNAWIPGDPEAGDPTFNSLRRLRTVLGLLVDHFDIDPVTTCVQATVVGVGGHDREVVASVCLADCLTEADSILAQQADA